jgi:hypothetical protein
MTDIDYELDADAAVAQRIADGLRGLRELRGTYDQAVADLEDGIERGKQRIAALQVEIDEENKTLVSAVNDAAVEFNEAAAELVETGFATPKALAAKGLGTLRIKK